MRWCAPDHAAQQPETADDDGQQIVKVVRHTARHAADGFERLRLAQRRLSPVALGDVEQRDDVAPGFRRFAKDLDMPAVRGRQLAQHRATAGARGRGKLAQPLGQRGVREAIGRERGADRHVAVRKPERGGERRIRGAQPAARIEGGHALADAVHGRFERPLRAGRPAHGTDKQRRSQQQPQRRDDAADEEGACQAVVRGRGALQPGREAGVFRVAERREIGADRLHRHPAEIGFDNRLRRRVSRRAHRGDRRGQLVHLRGDVGLKLEDALLLLGIPGRRRLQLAHQAGKALFRPVVRIEIVVAPCDQKPALAAFGGLDSLVDRGGRADRDEVAQGVGPSLARRGLVPRELEGDDGDDDDQRNRTDKQRKNDLSPGAPTLHRQCTFRARAETGGASRQKMPQSAMVFQARVFWHAAGSSAA
jgi:hypothetical protein